MRERKLATIQKIDKLEPIPKADRIEVASILGWKAVVQKGQFKEDESIVYFEIDSFLPIKPEFEFLREGCYKKFEDGREGFRIRTRRLRGQISQGLVMPINILPTGLYDTNQDVTELIGVIKYEPPMPKCLIGLAKGKFPSFCVKTDETRVQLLQEVINRYVGLDCYVTEKIDGSSVTYFIRDGIFGVASRNLELQESTNAYWKWARDNDVENKLREYGKNVAIQGEIYGSGINGNPLKIMGLDVRFFNVFNINKCQYLDYGEFTAFIGYLGFKTVPVITESFQLTGNINDLVKLSVGKSLITTSVWREGIVIRPLKEVLDLGMSISGFGNTGRLSFKVVNPEYLLTNEGA
jgi:RNA ligase (TIGR02306 family)